MTRGRQGLARRGRWVVKIGSALLTNDGQGLDLDGIERWVDQMAQLRQRGVEVVLVSSGSIAEGMKRLGWTRRPKEVYRAAGGRRCGADGAGAGV